MKIHIAVVTLLLFLVGVWMPGCAGSVSYERMRAADLAGSIFKSTEYRSSSGAPAVILDNPDDEIGVKPGKDWLRFKDVGMQTAARYLAESGWRPDVFGLRHVESGEVACYLLLSPELRWMFSYDEGRREISITIEDPHELPGDGT